MRCSSRFCALHEFVAQCGFALRTITCHSLCHLILKCRESGRTENDTLSMGINRSNQNPRAVFGYTGRCYARLVCVAGCQERKCSSIFPTAAPSFPCSPQASCCEQGMCPRTSGYLRMCYALIKPFTIFDPWNVAQQPRVGDNRNVSEQQPTLQASETGSKNSLH